MAEQADSHLAKRHDRASARRRPRLRLAALVVVSAIVGIVVWAVVRSTDSNSPTNTNAVSVSPRGLRTLAGGLRQSIYWVGPASNGRYELLRPRNGRILIGYLGPNLEVGTTKPHLTVGTYFMRDAYGVTQRAAGKPGTVRFKVVGSGAVAFYNKAYPHSAFIAYPGSHYQVEVYDPAPGRARQLVALGKVTPVSGSIPERSRPIAVSPKTLTKVASAMHHPIYWAGRQPNRTYELTRTTQGWVFVRYLPPGVGVGVVGKPYLTVGTYPVKNAFSVVKGLALAKGAVSIKLRGGGIAVVNHKFPRSVYLAYPGSNFQVEVFDPSLAHARRLVTSGQITEIQ